MNTNGSFPIDEVVAISASFIGLAAFAAVNAEKVAAFWQPIIHTVISFI